MAKHTPKKTTEDKPVQQGTADSPIVFNGEVESRSGLYSNYRGYRIGVFVLVGRAIYMIAGRPQECSGDYSYCYPVKPVRAY